MECSGCERRLQGAVWGYSPEFARARELKKLLRHEQSQNDQVNNLSAIDFQADFPRLPFSWRAE